MKVPEGWKIVQIQNVAKVNADTLSSNSDPDHKYLYIDLSAVDKGIVTMSQERQKLTDLPSRARRVLHKNDVIMATVRPNLLGFALCDYEPDDVLCSTGFALLSPKGSSDAGFIYQSLYSDAILRQLHGLVTGSNYPAINTSEVKKLELLWPQSETERQRIAEILNTWDEAIALTEQRIEAARQRKKGLMQRLLTGCVQFPEFAGMPWASYRIGDLLKAVERRVVWDDEDIYNLLSIKRRSGGVFPRESIRGCDIKTKQMNVPRAEDFLISKMQVVHGAWALNKPAFDGMHISSSYIALVSRDQSKLVIEFFDWLSRLPFMYHFAYLSSHGVHIEKMTFNLQDFLKYIIKIPSTVDEQKKIVAILDNCDREIELLTQKRDALQRQKKGLMQRLLTGRVRIRV